MPILMMPHEVLISVIAFPHLSHPIPLFRSEILLDGGGVDPVIFHSWTVALLIAFGVAVLILAVHLRHKIGRLLLRERRDVSQALKRLNTSNAFKTDLDEIAMAFITEITAMFQIQRAALFLKKAETDDFILTEKIGITSDPIRINSQHPMVYYFTHRDEPITHSDLALMPQFRALWQQESEDLDQIGASLYIPLKTMGKLVGILALGPKSPASRYTRADRQTLAILASQMAVAIENTLLLTYEAQRRYEADTLQKALAELTSDLDLHPVLENILTRLENVVPYDSASVFLVKDNALVVVATQGITNPNDVINFKVPIEEDELFLELKQTRCPLTLDDAKKDYRYKGYGVNADTRSWMGVPLITRGVTIGCLTMGNLEAGVYGKGEYARMAQVFASHAAVMIENARLFVVEREQHQLAGALRDIGTVLSTTQDFDNILDLLLDQIGRVVPYDIANILLVEGGRLRIVRTRYHESLAPETALLLKSSPFNISASSHIYYMLDSAQPLALSVVPAGSDWLQSPAPIGSWVGAPIVVKGKVVACFSLSKLEAGFYERSHAEGLVIFAGQAALALENARLWSENQQLAIIDDLTGLFSRRYLLDLATREFNRAQRYNRPLSVIVLDLDSFRRINETYGMAVGDQVLRVVAERCKANIREVDVLGRYGGEEFAIISPEAGPEEAQLIAERLRKHIARMPITTTAGPIHITVSLGTASLSSESPNIAKLVDSADYAVHLAKKDGGNKVCVFKEEDQ